MKLLIALLFVLFSLSVFTQTKTNVLVLGTLHQYHSKDSNYTYYDIIKILEKFKPDAICVEIREQEFRKELYLPEMVLGVVYGQSGGINTYPIDWWEGDEKRNVRTERDSLIRIPMYKKLLKKQSKLEKQNSIISGFVKEYGSDFRKLLKKSYLFFNGNEYSDYIRAQYKISLNLFGDSPMNLLWMTRNTKMYQKIEKVITENRNKNIIILTGCEHKYFFDDTLRTRNDVNVTALDKLMPLSNTVTNASTIDNIENANDSLYFLPGFPVNADEYFSTKLVPLVHGMQMDEKPEIIPEKNIVTTGKVVERWEKAAPKSFIYKFELGWYFFLTKNYEKSLQIFSDLDNNLDSLNQINFPTEKNNKFWFYNIMTNRTLGCCFDMMGMRKKALLQYNKGIAKIKNEKNMSSLQKKILIKVLFKNYVKKPFVGFEMKRS